MPYMYCSICFQAFGTCEGEYGWQPCIENLMHEFGEECCCGCEGDECPFRMFSSPYCLVWIVPHVD